MEKESLDMTKTEGKFSAKIEKFKTSYLTKRIAQINNVKPPFSDVSKAFDELEVEIKAFVDNIIFPLKKTKPKDKPAEFKKYYFQENPTVLDPMTDMNEYINEDTFKTDNLKNMMMINVL